MTNWYHRSMPTVSDVTPHVAKIASDVRAINGVNAVYVHGSYAANVDQPSFPLKDIDIIAVTGFHSGDLMAIDAGRDSPLKMAASEWEDYGFNPEAVRFTRSFLKMAAYGVDHWAASEDGKLLHWGPNPETIDEWKEAHDEAEKYASEITGYNRLRLAKQADTVKTHWRDAYMHSINRCVSKRQRTLGWVQSEHPSEEILSAAKRLS